MSNQLNEQQLDELKQSTLASLRSNTVKVLFTKQDGSQREMFCTLNEASIPSESLPKTPTVASTSQSAARVFDVEKQQWRSFRWDSVIKVSL